MGITYVMVILAIVLYTSGCICGSLDDTMHAVSDPVWAIGQIEYDICNTALMKKSGDFDHCVQDAAVRADDLLMCDDIVKDPPKTKCKMHIAVQRKDPDPCNEMNPKTAFSHRPPECLGRVSAVSGKDYCKDLNVVQKAECEQYKKAQLEGD
jgi:hypothetical protein